MLNYQLRVLWCKASRHKDGRSTALVAISLDNGSPLSSEVTGFMDVAKGKETKVGDVFKVLANAYEVVSRESADPETGEVKPTSWIVLK